MTETAKVEPKYPVPDITNIDAADFPSGGLLIERFAPDPMSPGGYGTKILLPVTAQENQAVGWILKIGKNVRAALLVKYAGSGLPPDEIFVPDYKIGDTIRFPMYSFNKCPEFRRDQTDPDDRYGLVHAADVDAHWPVKRETVCRRGESGDV